MESSFFALLCTIAMSLVVSAAACGSEVEDLADTPMELAMEPQVAPAQVAPAQCALPSEITPAAIVWPSHPDEACYECNQNPNCVWICPNGVRGTSNVSSELDCRGACIKACGWSAHCYLI